MRAGGPRLSIGILPAVFLFLWHNYFRFHSVWHTCYEGQGFTTPLYTGLCELAVSPGRGLFLYSPLTILGALSLPRFRRHFPAPHAFIVTAFAADILFFSGWWTWHGGWSWAPRFLVPIAPLLLIPVGARVGSRRSPLVAMAAWVLSLLVVVPGISVDFNSYIIDSY